MSRNVRLALVLLAIMCVGLGTANAQQLATGIVKDVGNAWVTVTLPQSYASMVVVCVPVYSGSDAPAVVRVQNATGNSFQVRVQDPGDLVALAGGYNVHYMVVEEGVYTQAANGVTMEAVKYLSQQTAENNAWGNVDLRTYQNTYSTPVVVGQVMTQNDTQWSVFFAHDPAARVDPPSATGLSTGKHVGEDPVTTRLDETLGYIVIEAGSGTINGVDYVAAVGPDIVEGIAEGAAPWAYSLDPLITATEVVASETAQDGADGSFAILAAPGPIVGNTVFVAIDEDQQNDAERAHTDDQLAYIAFNRGLEASVSRTITGTYTPSGAGAPISLTATALAGFTQVTVTETMPTGLTATNPTASSGTISLLGQTVVWNVTLGAGESATASYVATAGAVCKVTYTVSGTFDNNGVTVDVGGDTAVNQGSDGWQNALIAWAGSTDIPSGLAPQGSADWFACDNSYILHGAGVDIWGSADEFHFLYAYVLGDFNISALVDILPPNTNVWTKGGLMVRGDLTAGSPYIILALTNGGPASPADGNSDITWQWRDVADTGAAWDAATGGAMNNDEAFLILRRTGTTVTGDYDDNEGNVVINWNTRQTPAETQIDPAVPNLVGLCLTSHSGGNLANASFTNVALTGNVLPPPPSVSRSIAGEYTPGQGLQVTVTALATRAGQFTVTETVPATLPLSNVVASEGTATEAGGVITWTANPAADTSPTLTYTVTPPGTACGDIWTIDGTVVSGVVTAIILGDTNVTQASDGWQNAPITWSGSEDIPNTLSPVGRADYYACNDTYVIWNSGNDIWGTADQFHFLYVWVVGDFLLTAQVDQVDPDVNGWEKAGCMVRANLTAGSPHVMCIICESCRDSEPHIVAQERLDQGSASQRFDGRPDGVDPAVNSRIPNTGPAIVGVSRLGQLVAVNANNLEGIDLLAFWYGADRPNIPTDQPVALGLGYTSHNTGAFDRAVFSNVSLSANVASPPAAPTNLTASGFGADSILLQWVDNSNNETGFKIERSDGAPGTWVEIAVTGAQLTSYVDPGLATGTTYYYRVRATNATGDSAYSNEASAEPGGAPLDAKRWLLYR